MGGPRGGRLLAEINVTPFVDVMLVLLIIFMITSSVEKVDEQKKKQEEQDKKADLQRKVPIKLPKVNSKAVLEKDSKKLVLSMKSNGEFFLGETLLVACTPGKPKSTWSVCNETAPLFLDCMKKLRAKLVDNHKLKQDKEIYLRADAHIPYGCVLKTMAQVRSAGITKFGLVSDPEPNGPPGNKTK